MSFKKQRRITFLISFLSIFLLNTTQGQTMEVLLGIARSTGVPGMVVNSLSSFLEVPKTAHNEFNEHISHQNGRKAETVYQKEIEAIESNAKKWPRELTPEDPDYIQMKNQVLALYNRGEIALLTLDYVAACRDQIDKALDSIKEIMQQYNQPKLGVSFGKNDTAILETLDQFLQEIRINLGAALQTKYHYERGGGMVSRWNKHSSSQTTRFDEWGVTSFPALNLKTNAGVISGLKNQESVNALAKDILDVYYQYTCTIGFILKPEDMIILDFEGLGGINHYRQQLTNIFGQNVVLSPVNLYSRFFGINDKSTVNPKEKNDETGNVEEIPSFTDIQIPDNQEQK